MCPRLNRNRGSQAQCGRGRANAARGGRGGRYGNGGRNGNDGRPGNGARNGNGGRGGQDGNEGRNKNGGRGRGRGEAAQANATHAEPTLGSYEEQRATLFAAINNLAAGQQYEVIQVPATQGGESFQLLIACGSTHSFLSP